MFKLLFLYSQSWHTNSFMYLFIWLSNAPLYNAHLHSFVGATWSIQFITALVRICELHFSPQIIKVNVKHTCYLPFCCFCFIWFVVWIHLISLENKLVSNIIFYISFLVLCSLIYNNMQPSYFYHSTESGSKTSYYMLHGSIIIIRPCLSLKNNILFELTWFMKNIFSMFFKKKKLHNN